jgi:DNA-binding response OmpR family regulator
MTASETPPTTVLVVEDRPEIARLIRRSLMLEGYQVDVAEDGRSALAAIRDQPPDLIVLDLMLPDIDGIEITRRVRALEDADHLLPLPILMVTALDDVQDRVTGLDAGADDYLPKPFKFKELLARARAVLRRRTSAAERVLKFGDLELNRDTREVFQAGRPIYLTPRELDILEVFMLHPRQVMTRDVLLDRVWGTDYLGDGNLIEVHISALREKLGDQERRLIRTVRGVGYALSGAGLG